MNQIEQNTLRDGIHFRSVCDTKFKTFRISVNFFMPLKQKTAAANALLPYMLSRCSSEYPDYTAMSKKMASLYGASLSADVGKVGNTQVLTVLAGGIASRYTLQGEDTAGELTRVLCGALFSPVLENGLFREEDFRQEQRQTLEQIDAEYSDKRLFALKRCMETMCAGEAFGIDRYGTRDEVQALTREKVTQAWKDMLATARVEIAVLGDIDAAPVAKAFEKAFGAIERHYEPLPLPKSAPCRSKVLRAADHQAVAQGKMVLGMRTGIAQFQKPEMVPAMRLMSAVFGGTPSSRLFLIVREQMSLCYYCSAAYNATNGLMFVQSGVEFDNMQKAEAAVLEQLKAVQQGDFTDEDFEAAKLALVDSYHTVEDSLSALEGWYLTQTFAPKVYSPEEYAALIGAVSREEVVQAAEGVCLDTVYCLKGQEDKKQ
ncbi:MAG: pitrilysin family protein [Oscillospiraceae bacterium]|nr:pitrilysin family protein [Oscillospiraceae bacterium]